MEDTGIEVEREALIKIGVHTPNETWVETCNEVYVAKFMRKKNISGKISGNFDILQKGRIYPLNEFFLGPDALVNSALWMVEGHFGLIASKIKK